MDKNYEIYYLDGLKQGVSNDVAVQNLIKFFKVPAETAEGMIKAFNRVIKKGLTKDQAVKYFSVLNKAGLKVSIRETNRLVSSATVLTSDKETESNSPDTQVVVEQKASYDHALVHSKAGQINFTGKGFEYFKIWIVNIFLTILTLGIYSAWAKVRNKQYFYGNTKIDGNSFNYTAKPITILKGRLIAVGLLIMYVLISEFVPLLGLILLLILMAFLPWIIIRSLAFNARNSVFRNVRFNFTASMGEAVKAFLLWPLLMLPTLGFILPLVWYKQSRFLINNSSYGTTTFKIDATVKEFYKIFFIFVGALLALMLFMTVLMNVLGVDPNTPNSVLPFMMFSTPISVLAYFVMFGYFAAALGNLYYNTTTLVDHAFSSQLTTRGLTWIYFSNTLAIAFSLGLLIPWAQVRMASYRMNCLQLHVKDSLDDFIAAEEKNISALGEQVGEVFDMEVSVI